MKQPSCAELQQRVVKLEEQLQTSRTATWGTACECPVVAAGILAQNSSCAQSDGHAEQMLKVQNGVKMAKKSFFHAGG